MCAIPGPKIGTWGTLGLCVGFGLALGIGRGLVRGLAFRFSFLKKDSVDVAFKVVDGD